MRVALGGTVDELADRLNVRKQAEEKIAQGRALLIQKMPVIGASMGIGLLAIGALVVLRGGKKKKS